MSIRLEHVSHVYEADTNTPVAAIEDISLTIEDNQFIGIIGHTGSGKSTLIQHLNGLMRPTGGKVYFHDEDIWAEGFSLKNLRSKVGLVFQYPEYQLFEETVFKDVCFGPRNQGLSEEEIRRRALNALRQVGLEESVYEASPFELSGGQKRRAAIAGVLAMEPEILILDEPTAGLDPRGRDDILEQIAALQRERGITVVLVSHSMEDVAKYAGHLIVIHEGRIQYDAAPREVFAHVERLEEMGLAVPQVTYLMRRLRAEGYPLPENVITVEEAREALLKLYRQKL